MSLAIGITDFDRVSYDREADVLYLSVGDPASAVDFDETDDGHALRYDVDGQLVGVTIVGARRLADGHESVRVQAPLILSAETLASLVREPDAAP